MSTLTWALAIALGASLVLQGVALRIVHRRRVTTQQARYLQFQQIMNDKFEQTKRQIGQLQSDLAASRQQVKQLSKDRAASVQRSSPARQMLERKLDNEPRSRHSLPIDGFADTQPSSQVTQHGSLLLQ